MAQTIIARIDIDPSGSLAKDVCFAFQRAWGDYKRGIGVPYDTIDLTQNSSNRVLARLSLPAYPGAIGLVLVRAYFAAHYKAMPRLCDITLAEIGSAFAGADAELGITQPLKMDEAVKSITAIGRTHGCRL